jgi:cytochrome c oxidase subunit 2
MILIIAFAGLADRLPQGSSMAPRVDGVFIGLLAMSGLLVALLLALNLTFLVRYRRGSRASRAPLRWPVWKIEAGWITVTTLVFLGFFAWGASIYLDLEHPPANATVIEVVGRQWMWDVRHGNGRREFDTLHVPVGQVIRLQLTSEDVIHSFFVPAFRIKQDVVPGKTINTWFEATQPGTYHLFCTQYCGTKHAGMIGEVIAQTPEEYAAWLTSGNVENELADRGRRLFLRYGCSGCHAPSSTVHAPPLEGLYGKRVPLEGGGFVTVDDAYLRDSILEPAKQIAGGYPNVMPSFKGVIPEGDLLDLLSYLKSLADATPAPTPTPARP